MTDPATEPIPVRIETRKPTETEIAFIADEVVKVVGLTMDLALSRLTLDGSINIGSDAWQEVRRSVMFAAADKLRWEAEQPRSAPPG